MKKYLTMKNLRIAFIVIWALLLISEITVIAPLMQMNILPTKYLSLVIGIFAFISLTLGCILLIKPGKYQKVRGLTIRIIASVFSITITLFCFIGSSMLSHVNNTLSSVTAPSVVSSIIHVYVQNTDPAQTITDAKNYTFGVTDSFDWGNIQKSVAAINKETNSTITTKNYPSAFAMIDALYAGEVQAVILHSSQLDIIEDIDAYKDFTDKTRVLFTCTFTHDDKTQADPLVPNNDPSQTSTTPPTDAPVINNVEGNSFLLYISGSDSRSQVLTNSRSDVNIIAVVNPDTKQILLINTPRDYYVGNPAGGGAKDKLTHCGIYGIDCSRKALESLYKYSIAYHARINFTGFETLVNAVGGVTVYSEISFVTSRGKYQIYAGDNYLNGHQALCYARERYAFASGDIQRGKNQMKIISAVIGKLSASTIISNYSQILNSLSGMFATNMPQSKISDLIKMQLEDMSKWNIQSYAVSGYNGYDVNYSMPGMKAYVMYPNEKEVNRASELIGKVLAGEILTAKDVK